MLREGPDISQYCYGDIHVLHLDFTFHYLRQVCLERGQRDNMQVSGGGMRNTGLQDG